MVLLHITLVELFCVVSIIINSMDTSQLAMHVASHNIVSEKVLELLHTDPKPAVLRVGKKKDEGGGFW